MTPERWRKVKEVFGAALELPAEDQAAYVAGACGGDADLQKEVRSLIASHREAGDLFDSPALEGNASMVTRAAGRLMQGARFGSYRVVEQIGEGGMGSVYRGYDEGDPARAPVAIKVVKLGFDHDDILRRFRRERQILAALDHPNIAQLLDAGAGDDGVPYFVMEYIDGQRIDRYCEALRLSVDERLRLLQSVCAAVDYAHQHRILHRDIKPGNVLITAAGEVKLLDFGIGKILDPAVVSPSLDVTATMLRMMTPEYASPEQLRGEKLTEVTDIYSLGLLLCEIVTGERPQRSGAPRRLLPGDLEAIARKALHSDPRQRYSSAAGLAQDIGRYLEGKRVEAGSGTLKKVAVWGAAASGAAVLAVLAVLAWSRYSERTPMVSRPPAGILPFTTFPGDEFQPYFSGDGSKIVFVWNGEDGRNADVYIKPVAGASLQRLTTNAAQDVSPTWSPDGKRLAFLRTSPKETAVFVANSDGSGVHGLIAEVYPTRIETVGRHLDWSRDGQWLAVADKTAPGEPFAIFMVEAATGRKRRITTPPVKTMGDSNPVFSPDGGRLAFLRSTGDGVSDIYVMPLNGSPDAARLTFDNRSISSLTWTPDGRLIVFASDRTGGRNLWRIRATPGAAAPERLPGIGENASDPAFAKDGLKLAYSQTFRDANIWRVDLSPEGRSLPPARQLIASTLYDSSPQISPDGSKVAFRSSRSGTNEIWVCDSEGAHCEQMTRFGGPLTGSPRWSPDGRFIAFDSRPQGQSDIYVVSTEGGFPQQVTQDASEDVVPSWSADSRWIYFASNRTGSWQVWKSAVTGGAGIQVTRNGGFAASESPGGKFVYYAKGRGVAGLWRTPAAGGNEEEVLPSLKPGFWGYWALARTGVYYVDRASPDQNAVIYFLDFRTGRITPVYRMERPPSVADSAFALSPDGSYLLFSQIDNSGSDIMVADYSP